MCDVIYSPVAPVTLLSRQRFRCHMVALTRKDTRYFSCLIRAIHLDIGTVLTPTCRFQKSGISRVSNSPGVLPSLLFVSPAFGGLPCEVFLIDLPVLPCFLPFLLTLLSTRGLRARESAQFFGTGHESTFLVHPGHMLAPGTRLTIVTRSFAIGYCVKAAHHGESMIIRSPACCR